MYHPSTEQEYINNRDETLQALLEANATSDGIDKLIIKVEGLKRSRASELLRKKYLSENDVESVSNVARITSDTSNPSVIMARRGFGPGLASIRSDAHPSASSVQQPQKKEEKRCYLQ